MGRRDLYGSDASLRASDNERNVVADNLARHYAEGRLDEAEFKARLDTAMSATTRGDLNGLFHDLPRLPSEPPPPPPWHRRVPPWIFVAAFVALVVGATIPFAPLTHVPWLLVAAAVAAFVVWRRAGHRPARHPHRPGGRSASSVLEH